MCICKLENSGKLQYKYQTNLIITIFEPHHPPHPPNSEKPVPENFNLHISTQRRFKIGPPWGMNIDIRSIKTSVNTTCTKFQIKYPVQISPLNTTSIMSSP